MERSEIEERIQRSNPANLSDSGNVRRREGTESRQTLSIWVNGRIIKRLEL